ncbi:helix-turn-helix domain-containing protein [Flavobacterium sp.]|uniref:helix-turn-helix domain-containing protein n=1 Tax=Flavobacterium sp. TaxID=239 RepID=UPI0037532D15
MKNIRKKEIPIIVINVGLKINEIIKQKNLRQRDVAHDAGLDVENLRKYIKGKQEMKISTMIKIVESLQISVQELFTEPKTPN